MRCKGILFYTHEIPHEFGEHLRFRPREHAVCVAVESACPKSRGKCKITQTCWKVK